MERREVAILQHMANEPGGIIEEYLLRQGIPLRRVELFAGDEVPLLRSTHLVVMGGPMSVNDEKEYPFLLQEKELVREWVRRGRPVLGICLGAQLIASAGGAAVYSCEPELGWCSVSRATTAFTLLPDRLMVFQMHGETFDLPFSAQLMCRGDRIPSQALCWGSALGLQFHLELTGEMIQDWIKDQPSEEQARILTMNERYLSRSQHHCMRIAERFLNAPGHGFSWI